MRKTFIVILTLIVILIMISGCSKDNDTFLIEKIENSFPNDVQHDEIYHIEIIKMGLLVFYKSTSGFGAGFIKQKSNAWEWVSNSGYASLKPDDGLSVVFSNRDEIPLYFSYGIITNPDIIEVISSVDDAVNKAKIIQTSNGIRIWFHTYDAPLSSPFPLIVGISKEGKQIATSES